MATEPAATLLRAAVIAALERQGAIKPDCRECQEAFYKSSSPESAFYPRHTAMVSCQSGRDPHCTCDTCF